MSDKKDKPKKRYVDAKALLVGSAKLLARGDVIRPGTATARPAVSPPKVETTPTREPVALANVSRIKDLFTEPLQGDGIELTDAEFEAFSRLLRTNASARNAAAHGGLGPNVDEDGVSYSVDPATSSEAFLRAAVGATQTRESVEERPLRRPLTDAEQEVRAKLLEQQARLRLLEERLPAIANRIACALRMVDATITHFLGRAEDGVPWVEFSSPLWSAPFLLCQRNDGMWSIYDPFSGFSILDALFIEDIDEAFEAERCLVMLAHLRNGDPSVRN